MQIQIMDAGGSLVRQMQAPGRGGIESHILGFALRRAADDRAAHHAAGKSAHLGRAAFPGTGIATDNALGHDAEPARTDGRSGQIHRKDHCGR